MKNILNLEKSDQMQIKEVTGDDSVWMSVLNEAEYYTMDFSLSYITLCDLTMKAKFDDVQTYRIAFFIQKKGIAAWVIQVREKEGIFQIGTNEGYVMSPVFCCGVSERMRKKVIDGCINVILGICKEKKIKCWNSICPIREEGVDLWQRKILDSKIFDSRIEYASHVLYTKLQSEKDPFSNYRKSFKSLVNVDRKRWNVELYDKITFEQMNRFRTFHIAVKGKETRSVETWKAQMDAINSGEAFLIILTNKQQEIHGGGIFLLTPYESYYNSAAYDKKLREEPLGHMVQHAAIEYARKRGLQWHRLGEKYLKNDPMPPSEKELQISHFKEGFSTNTFLDVVVKCDLLI